MAMAALRREGRRLLLSPTVPNPSPAAASAAVTRSSAISQPEMAPLGARCISTQIVRNRMKSVKNIQKITKAMKMVAASKLRAVQTRTENSRGLWEPFTALLGDAPSVDVKKTVIVAITSDKGLCGGINSTSVKVSRALHKLTFGPEKESKYVILGEKGKVQLVRDSRKSIEMTVTELQKNPINYTQVDGELHDTESDKPCCLSKLQKSIHYGCKPWSVWDCFSCLWCCQGKRMLKHCYSVPMDCIPGHLHRMLLPGGLSCQNQGTFVR